MFERYLQLLLKWNKTYNLTSITDPKEIQIKHFEDSLAPLPFLANGARLLDIGTGAGFPGIPLKISKPNLDVVLLDSQRKKISFCEAVIRELKLTGIKAVHGRSDDAQIQKQADHFDVVISRATFSIADFLSEAVPFLKANGCAIAMKGRNWEEEYKETDDWKLEKIFDYDLSESQGKRTLLIFKRASVALKP